MFDHLILGTQSNFCFSKARRKFAVLIGKLRIPGKRKVTKAEKYQLSLIWILDSPLLNRHRKTSHAVRNKV